MNLTIERTPALAALSRLVGVVERKNVIPILGNVALSASQGALRFRATDLDMEAIETIDAEVADFGDITLPADKLRDIVRNAAPGAQVSLAQEDLRVIVKSGRSRFNVPALNAADFPTFESKGLEASFSMPAAVLADMLARVVWAVTPNAPQSVTGYVFLGSSGDEIHAAACSTQGIAVRREPLPAGAEISAILPLKLVAQLVRWLAAAEGLVDVSCSGPLVRFQHEGAVLTSKLFDAPAYAPYLSALIDNPERVAVTDQDALSAAVKRVLVMSDGKTQTLRFSFVAGGLTIQARGADAGEGVDEIAADYEGPEFSFLLKASRVLETLAALRGDRIEIGFSVDASLCVQPQDHHKVVLRAPADPQFTTISMQPRA
jgi:DNA polymerase-3 subunit beta